MLTYLATALVSLVPGLLIGFAIPPGRERWVAWATAPVLTLGLITAGVAWLPVTGLPSGALWVFGTEIVLGLLIAAGSWLAARRRAAAAPAGIPAAARVPAAATAARGGGQASGPGSAPLRAAGGGPASEPRTAALTWREWLLGGPQRPRLADLAGAAAPAAVAVAFGRLFLGSLSEPAGWDAMNHAYFARSIIDAGTTKITAICTTGQPLPHVACHFYPISADVSWAQAAVLSHGRIGAVMLAWSVLIGPPAVTLAAYAAVRIFGGRPLVASCAAIAPTLLSHMWPGMVTGRPQEVFAPGLSIAIAVLTTLAFRGKYPVRLGLLAGLGLAGLVMTHTYDVLFAGVLALTFLIADRAWVRRRTALPGLATIVLAALAVCVPLTGGLLAVRGETALATHRTVEPFSWAWHYWVTGLKGYTLLSPSPLHSRPIQAALWLTVPCLLASPLSLVLKELRWARPWLATWVLWTALGMWAAMSHSAAARFLSSLWYAQEARVRAMAYPVQGVLAVAGACAIGLVLYRLARTARRGPRSMPLQSAAAGTLAVSLIGLAALPSVHMRMVRSYHRSAPFGTSYPHAFSWLAKHTAPGKVIAYDSNEEFIAWAHDDYNVPALFGFAPLTYMQDHANRLQAWYWLVNNPGAAPAGCLVRKFGIEYVVTGYRLLPGHTGPPYSRADLARSPNVSLVHHDGGIRIYRVTKAGMACPG